MYRFSLDLPLFGAKGHGSNIWVSANRIGLFHWTLELGPSSKVALKSFTQFHDPSEWNLSSLGSSSDQSPVLKPCFHLALPTLTVLSSPLLVCSCCSLLTLQPWLLTHNCLLKCNCLGSAGILCCGMGADK